MDFNWVYYAFLFLFLGVSVGSFLNVLIDRLPRGEQIFKGRSYCESCKKTLAWYDLIPLFSWISLRGHCRYCAASLGIYYPLVELTTGILFVSAFITHPGGVPSFFTLPYSLFIFSTLIVIFFADLKYQIIPDEVVFPAIAVAFIFQLVDYKLASPVGGLSIISLTNPLFSALGAALFFLSLVLLTRGRGMGVGDVKLALLIGLLLGFPGIIIALYLAFLTGAILGVILVLLGKKRFGQKIPFGPFLVGATFASLFWGTALWHFFQKILSFS